MLLYRLKTDVAEIIRAIQVVLHRGSLRAVEEQTGHNYETIAAWIKRVGDHAEALTDLLVHDLHLSEVELDKLWSFVGQKGGQQTSAEQGDPRSRITGCGPTSPCGSTGRGRWMGAATTSGHRRWRSA